LKTLLSADSSVVLKEDANGDNPLSLLWKNTLVSREKKIEEKIITKQYVLAELSNFVTNLLFYH
jgi:hypothetical protein